MEHIKKIPFYNKLLVYFFITIGAAASAYALECVLLPNSILDGGVNGISIILNILFGWRLSILIPLINTSPYTVPSVLAPP